MHEERQVCVCVLLPPFLIWLTDWGGEGKPLKNFPSLTCQVYRVKLANSLEWRPFWWPPCNCVTGGHLQLPLHWGKLGLELVKRLFLLVTFSPLPPYLGWERMMLCVLVWVFFFFLNFIPFGNFSTHLYRRQWLQTHLPWYSTHTLT